MSVQDAVQQRIAYADGEYLIDESKSIEDLYNRARKNAFTQYSYGVWTTAHARMSLQAGIDLCGDNLIYVDTDSCKFAGDVDFSAYNADRIAECKQSGAFATDPQGVTHYMGVYENETAKGKLKRFITLGAKKYAYEDAKGELHITVSGVGKKSGAAELKANGGIEAFQPGFIFHHSGKTESVYNDERKPLITNIDGHMVTITRNVVIRDTTYTLSTTDDYEMLLNVSSNMLNKVHKFWLNCQLQ